MRRCEQFLGILAVLWGIILVTPACQKQRVTMPDTGNTGGTGVVWYVSTQGSDANSGQSRDSAFRTLRHALEVVRPGETIVILPGTYTEEIEVFNLGDGSAPITIRGETQASGNAASQDVVFDGQNTRRFMFRCWQCRGIVIEHLKIRNYRWTAVSFWQQSAHITIRNLHIERSALNVDPDIVDGAAAIAAIEVSDVVIENNTIEHTGMKDIQRDKSGYGIDCWRCINGTIRNNQIRQFLGDGILVEESCHVTVEGNTIEDGDMQMLDWWSGGIWLDGGKDVRVRHNTLRNNNGPGIQVSDTEVVYPQGFSRDFVIENNVSEDNEFGIYMWNYGQCPPPTDAVRLRGNTFRNNRQRDVWCVEWQCGVGQPCVEPEPDLPDC